MKYAAALAAIALAVVAGSAVAGDKPPVVVELYTSQGCSSCPPADALLAKLANQSDRNGVIAMSLPVTYWDLLGWKDTLASDANTRRQKAYAAAMGRGGVYTPQIIVDGVTDVVGNRAEKVAAAIEAIQKARETAEDTQEDQDDNEQSTTAPKHPRKVLAKLPPVAVALLQAPQALRVAIAAAPPAAKTAAPNATIWVFRLRSSATVRIDAGENSGRTMTYRNIVVGPIKEVGRWNGKAVTLDIPHIASPPHDGLVVLVQQGGYGRVLGAAYLARTDYCASK